jgi:hypothetical protein
LLFQRKVAFFVIIVGIFGSLLTPVISLDFASATSDEGAGDNGGGGDNGSGDNGGGGDEPEPEPNPDPGLVPGPEPPVDPCLENPQAEGCAPEPPVDPCIENPNAEGCESNPGLVDLLQSQCHLMKVVCWIRRYRNVHHHQVESVLQEV